MDRPRQRVRRRALLWVLMCATTGLLTVDPALFLVLLALALAAVAVIWILLLARLLIGDALAAATRQLANWMDRTD